MKQQQTIEWIDSLRAIAAISVIVVHVSTPVVKMVYDSNMPFWWIGNVIDASVRFCVPIFLMISGALLLGKEDTLSHFYKKRFLRVLVPFLFWLVVYFIYSWFIEKPQNRPYGFAENMNWAGSLFIKTGVSKHFWFVYMLLILYIFMPFIGKGVRRLSEKGIVYLLVGWVVLNSLHMADLIRTDSLPSYIDKAYLYFRYVGYLVLGFYLSRKDFSSIKWKSFGGILFIGSILITALGTYYISDYSGKLNLKFHGYLTLNTLMQAVGLFMLIKDTVLKNKIASWMRNTVSNYSYGIYLVHIIVIGVFYLNGIFWTMAYPLISVPLITLGCLVISACIIYILRKLPYGVYFAG